MDVSVFEVFDACKVEASRYHTRDQLDNEIPCRQLLRVLLESHSHVIGRDAPIVREQQTERSLYL